MNFFEINPLKTEQLPEVLELDQLCLGGLWTLEGYQRELDSPNSDLLVISTGQELIGLGCLWAILEEAHITILAIHPQYQRQGLGRMLLQTLLAYAQRRGLERATLEVRVSNLPAIRLYEQFGFREAGRRKRYYQDTNEDALILWRGGLHYPEFEQTLTEWQQQSDRQLLHFGWQRTQE